MPVDATINWVNLKTGGMCRCVNGGVSSQCCWHSFALELKYVLLGAHAGVINIQDISRYVLQPGLILGHRLLALSESSCHLSNTYTVAIQEFKGQ